MRDLNSAIDTALLIVAIFYVAWFFGGFESDQAAQEVQEISAIKPEITALIIIDRKEFITPDGMIITATEYNNGMTCYRSDFGSVWVSCDGGLSRSETSERTKRHTERMKQSINSIEKE